MKIEELARMHCAPLSGDTHRLTNAEVKKLIAELPDWQREGSRISRSFAFANYDETMAFANGVAWLSQRENHHPDMTVGYNRCTVAYSTHDVGGLSLNDFICAAKIEALRAL